MAFKLEARMRLFSNMQSLPNLANQTLYKEIIVQGIILKNSIRDMFGEEMARKISMKYYSSKKY